MTEILITDTVCLSEWYFFFNIFYQFYGFFRINELHLRMQHYRTKKKRYLQKLEFEAC